MDLALPMNSTMAWLLGAGDCGRDFAAGGLGTALALAPTLSLLGLRSILGFSGALSDSGRSYFTPPGAKTFAVFFEDPTSRAASLGLGTRTKIGFIMSSFLRWSKLQLWDTFAVVLKFDNLSG